jgi:hypothetical protein
MSESFDVTFDDKARLWLNEHPSQNALVIAYDESRCCEAVTFVTCGSVAAGDETRAQGWSTSAM